MKLPIYFLLIFTIIFTTCQTENETQFSDFIGDWYCVNYFDDDGNRLKYPEYHEFTLLKDSSICFYHDEIGQTPSYSKNAYETLNLEMIGDSVSFEIIWNDSTRNANKYFHRMPTNYTYCMSYQRPDTTGEIMSRIFHLNLEGAAELIRSTLKGQPATYEEIREIFNLDVLKEEGIYEEYDQLFKDYASDFQ